MAATDKQKSSFCYIITNKEHTNTVFAHKISWSGLTQIDSNTNKTS